MKRTLWISALSAVVLAAGGTLLVRGSGKSDKREAPPVAEAPKPAGGAAEVAKPAEADKPAAPSNAGNTPKPGAAGTKAAEERGQLLETVGCLTAAHAFQTYLNIGFIADGKGHGIYSEKDARRVLQSVLTLLDSVDRRLETLNQVNLNKDDRESLEQMRAISALLRQQAKELQNYWERGQDEDLARYETVRKNSYAAISKLLGIGQ